MKVYTVTRIYNDLGNIEARHVDNTVTIDKKEASNIFGTLHKEDMLYKNMPDFIEGHAIRYFKEKIAPDSIYQIEFNNIHGQRIQIIATFCENDI